MSSTFASPLRARSTNCSRWPPSKPRADHVSTPRRTRAVTRTGGRPSAVRTLVTGPVSRQVPAGGENSATYVVFAVVSCASIACGVLSALRSSGVRIVRPPGPLKTIFGGAPVPVAAMTTIRRPGAIENTRSPACAAEAAGGGTRNGPTSQLADHDCSGSNHSLPKPKRSPWRPRQTA